MVNKPLTYEDGFANGYHTAYGEVLTILEQYYREPSVKRGSQVGKTILEVTRRVSRHRKASKR